MYAHSRIVSETAICVCTLPFHLYFIFINDIILIDLQPLFSPHMTPQSTHLIGHKSPAPQQPPVRLCRTGGPAFLFDIFLEFAIMKSSSLGAFCYDQINQKRTKC